MTMTIFVNNYSHCRIAGTTRLGPVDMNQDRRTPLPLPTHTVLILVGTKTGLLHQTGRMKLISLSIPGSQLSHGGLPMASTLHINTQGTQRVRHFIQTHLHLLHLTSSQ